jgi:hypothetical protein
LNLLSGLFLQSEAAVGGGLRICHVGPVDKLIVKSIA